MKISHFVQYRVCLCRELMSPTTKLKTLDKIQKQTNKNKNKTKKTKQNKTKTLPKDLEK